jgi:hypothetical protein
VYKIMAVEPKGKSSLGRSRRKWENNINIYLKEIGREGLDWIHLIQDTGRWRTLVTR